MLLPFVLLGLSICAVWLPPIPVPSWRPVPLWLPLFLAAVLAGLAVGLLELTAVAALGALAALAWWSNTLSQPALKAAAIFVVIVLALALALHAVPGFRNPVVIDAVRLSADSQPFTQYANFDKGAVGLLLLATLVPLASGLRDKRRAALIASLAALATATVVLGTAVALDYVRWDPKWPAVALTFLAINLLFTCVAEEAFFRGVIQERLARACANVRWLAWLPIAVSTILFAVAHAGGGMVLVALAAIAGLGYSLAYAWTRRIEAAIVAHFAVNAAHFVGFSYPQLAR